MRSRSASGMPGPASMTSMMAQPSSRRTSTRDRRLAVALRVVEEIADQPAQQPCDRREARPARHATCTRRNGRIPRRRAQAGRSAPCCSVGSGVEPARQQDLIDQGVKFGNIVGNFGFASWRPVAPHTARCPSRMRDSGVFSSCEALASSSRWAPTSSSMRAAAWLKLSASRATSSRPSTLTRAARLPAPERLDAGLQPLEPSGEAAHHGIGTDGHRERNAAEKEHEPK